MYDVEKFLASAQAAQAQGDLDQALRSALRAANTAPDDHRAQNLLGNIYTEAMEFEASRRAYEAAVAADPSQAYSHVNLAYAFILEGDFEAAKSALARSLNIDPGNAAALLNLSWIHKTAVGDPLIDQIESALRKSGLDAMSEAFLRFALGKCLDDIGEYDRAFAAFKEANQLSAAATGARYDLPNMQARFDSIKRTYTKAFVAKKQAEGYASERPVFIIGFPRCGSTLLEQKLGTHPDTAALGERPEIMRYVMTISARHPQRALFPEWAAQLQPGALAHIGRQYVERFVRSHPSAARTIDKNLLNFPFAGLIATALPQARFIDCRRNALDTCFSCFSVRLKEDHVYKFDLANLGRHYRFYADILGHWRNTLDAVETSRYETFIADPQRETTRLFRFLGLRDTTDCGLGDSPRHIQTASAFQARQPVYKSAVGRWKNYERHLGPLIDALGDLAET